MPAPPGKERPLLTRFLRAYEAGSWANASLDWVDERLDSAVELVATRSSDGATLAIEHTVIQPHSREKADLRHRRSVPCAVKRSSKGFAPSHTAKVCRFVRARATGTDAFGDLSQGHIGQRSLIDPVRAAHGTLVIRRAVTAHLATERIER